MGAKDMFADDEVPIRVPVREKSAQMPGEEAKDDEKEDASINCGQADILALRHNRTVIEVYPVGTKFVLHSSIPGDRRGPNRPPGDESGHEFCAGLLRILSVTPASANRGVELAGPCCEYAISRLM